MIHIARKYGSPGENDETIRETIEVIRKTRPHQIFISKMYILPGTPLFTEMKEKGKLDDNVWFKDNAELLYYTEYMTKEVMDEKIKEIGDAFNNIDSQYTAEELKPILAEFKDAQSFFYLGLLSLKEKKTERVVKKSVFIPFHFKEAAANVLTNPAVDPIAKIPEYKVCAVKVEKV